MKRGNRRWSSPLSISVVVSLCGRVRPWLSGADPFGAHCLPACSGHSSLDLWPPVWQEVHTPHSQFSASQSHP